MRSQKMGRFIPDEFARLRIDKRLRYRLRKARDQRCLWCGKPLKTYPTLCDGCMDKNNKRGIARYARLHPEPVIPE